MAASGRVLGAVAGGVVAAGAAVAAYSALIEPRAFRVREERMRVLPPGSRPISVLHLADIHLAPWQREKLEWLEGLTSLEPDLIINTGDSLGHPAAIAPLAAALEAFRGVPGFFVHGSNDRYGPKLKNPLRYLGGPSKPSGVPDDETPTMLDVAELEAAYAGLGWLDLNNAAHAFSIHGVDVAAFGVDDPHIGRDRLDRMASEVARMDAALGDAPRVTLGVVHAPYRRILDRFVELGADALFAGHTHGGQVRVPGGDAIVTNCDIPREQASGLSLWRAGGRAVPLNVSQGIGASIFAPVRLGTPPEAVHVVLEPRTIG